MVTLFHIQMIASFVVGGGLIALLSFLAERSSERIAGMIISLPSTAAISYFFIGLATSPQTVADIIPAAPFLVVSTMIFTLTYLEFDWLKFLL